MDRVGKRELMSASPRRILRAMNCPRCAAVVLHEHDRDGITIDVCATCRGIWLDRGELERLRARWMQELEREFGGPGRGAGPVEASPRRYDQDPLARARDDDDDDDDDRRRHAPGGPPPKKRRWMEMFDLFD